MPAHVGIVDLPIDDLVLNATLYFRATGDRDSRIWLFKEDVPSKFFSGSFCTGDDDFQIEVLDLFRGRHPLLVNYESVTKQIDLQFRPTAILDSNVVSYLHQYVDASPLLTASRRQTIRELLNFFIRKGLDYNPFFYYIEGSARNEHALLVKHAAAFSASILRLHMMDNAHFLSTGEIKIDESIFELYKNDYGTSDFAEIAAAHAKHMVQPVDFDLEWRNKISYASLLKIALIHRTSNCGIRKKYETFKTFMEETFNIALGTERYLALLYFSGQFEHFIPIQKGANPDRILARLRSATWDLLLLNFPTYLLVRKIPDGIYLGFPCSCDKALCSIGHAYSLEAVMAWAPHSERPVPMVNYDLSSLEKNIGAESLRRILTSDAEWQKSRRQRDLHSEKHISLELLEQLTQELEQQVIAYCNS